MSKKQALRGGAALLQKSTSGTFDEKELESKERGKLISFPPKVVQMQCRLCHELYETQWVSRLSREWICDECEVEYEFSSLRSTD